MLGILGKGFHYVNAMLALIEGVDDLQVWILGSLMALLIPSLAYFLVREFKRKDQIGEDVKELARLVHDSIDRLNCAVSTLTLAINEIKIWSQDRFVTRFEFTSCMEQMKEDITAHAERFSRELDRHEERCSTRDGD